MGKEGLTQHKTASRCDRRGLAMWESEQERTKPGLSQKGLGKHHGQLTQINVTWDGAGGWAAWGAAWGCRGS